MTNTTISMFIQTRLRINHYPTYRALKANLKRGLFSIIIASHLPIQAHADILEPIAQISEYVLSDEVMSERAEKLNVEESNLNTEDGEINSMNNIEVADGEMIHLENVENSLMDENMDEGNEQLLKQDIHMDKNSVQIDEITDNHYLVELGVNFLLPIAVNHLNRIETPFIQPEIKTSSEAVIEIEGNVLYVLVNHNEPVSLFITESNQSHRAISLTLVAKRIPPRTVTLEILNLDNIAHKQWTTYPKDIKSKDYISNLKTILTAVARNELPSGYTQRRTQLTQDLVLCYQLGVDHGLSDAITLIGEELIVYITKVTNLTQEQVSLNEASCKGFLVKAISFFPYQKLQPGQSTEMFVVTNRAK
ncbi:TraK domain-containing protein [Thorsellia anophelis]|uniref:TraK protein n=1 Tax=Thorsellia anophelis DSM 18579 TaxID=1123402 RepID=A0A1I0CZE2_9GAMM|nr:type-F conjugative transfer system secretin TraK [Thorsellia anophelis]SET25165.1 TraK protein [Thorsellia anophelis DSM 18579]